MYSLDRTVDAVLEPVTVAQAKAHCRVETDGDNDLLALYIRAARQYCEEQTGRAFLQQTWRLGLDRFPGFGCGRGFGTGWYDNPLLLDTTYGGRKPYWRVPEILLPRPELIGIVSVTYLDLTGTRQTLDPALYAADFDSKPATLVPAPGNWWPYGLYRAGSVQVTYNAGYGNTAANVPAALQLAILQLVGHWYENREATVLPDSGTGVVSVPLGVADILQSYALDLFTLES